MSDHHHHHHLHRPHRLSLPPRTTNPSPSTTTSRPYPFYNFPPSTPIPTPSKSKPLSLFTTPRSSSKPSSSSISSLFLLLFSLRSLYSLLPFLRSSPSSFSLFPFSFLVSFFSFLFTLSFSLLSPISLSSKHPFHLRPSQSKPIFSLSSLTHSQHKALIFKSLVLAIVFLLRFQALRYCGTAAMILAELSGNVAARFVAEGNLGDFGYDRRNRSSKFRGFFVLFSGLFLLAMSWDRIVCFPCSAYFVEKFGFSLFPRENCVRIWPMLLPFLSGFLGCYERVSMNWGTCRELARKQVKLITLFYTTVVLFIPAVIGIFIFEHDGESISISNLGWPLANTVVFGVLLSENYSDEKLATPRDFQREFLVTFGCTLVLELIYFPELSLWGLLLCGLLLYIAVIELDPVYSRYLEMGLESSETFPGLSMKPIRVILSDRKSRKIALFLLINTGYMVVEFVVGFMSNSLGLISDACHMLFDCAALAIGLYASYIARLPANGQFNYGRGRFEVLSGYANAVFLVLVGALIVLESIERILDPQEISTNSLLVVSIGGLAVNVIGLIFFHEEHHHAHGGSCSHSHSHSLSHTHSHTHSHHHNHRDNCNPIGHAHEGHDAHHECISVVTDCHNNSGSGQDMHHGHHQCDHKGSKGKVGVHSIKDSDSQSHHDHAHHSHHDCLVNDQLHIDHHTIKTSSNDHSFEHSAIGNTPMQSAVSCTHTHHSDSHVLPEESQTDLKNLHTIEGRNHHHIDHNMQGIFLHVLADTLGSVGVVVSTLLIKYKGWLAADPACSIFISIMIIASVIPLLRNSAEILLQRVPRAHERDLFNAVSSIRKIREVRGIPNLHVWSLTNTDVVGTIHLLVGAESDKVSAKEQVSHLLHEAGIKDLTLQVEVSQAVSTGASS